MLGSKFSTLNLEDENFLDAMAWWVALTSSRLVRTCSALPLVSKQWKTHSICIDTWKVKVGVLSVVLIVVPVPSSDSPKDARTCSSTNFGC